MRVHENVKRFARNYATLFIVFFACALYGSFYLLCLASLALWELFKYCSDRWKFDRHPSARKLMIGIGQCATAVLLTFLNVQMALFSALAVIYSVMLLHAGFRKLNPSKKQSRER
ncbi:unnamed protein product [Eruca vesicaria subsp. sativa]|uniref:PRA1 family protein n=1 Tax=Eruca vesicaria subsp. sativa TaxID=29727 RepID=A0ABC8L0J9_ERUVS|nr:unnamed protein product [Eruca vesicaria subsp. sativa]